ncbi:MAG: ZIP family metal transporter [Oligoflexus sp.]
MNLFQVLALASLTTLGNYVGGFFAEMVKVTGKRLNLALHAAAGILFAVVGVELIPRALQEAPPWQVVLLFLLGGVAIIGIKAIISSLQKRQGANEEADRSSMIYFSVAVDLFSDGLLIGAGSTVSFELALLLALAQVSADIPEGFATMVTFKRHGYSRRTRILLSAGFIVPVLSAAAFSYLVLRDQDPAFQVLGLAFAAGMLIVGAAEDMMPEAHESADDTPLSQLIFVTGFGLFTLLSAYFG